MTKKFASSLICSILVNQNVKKFQQRFTITKRGKNEWLIHNCVRPYKLPLKMEKAANLCKICTICLPSVFKPSNWMKLKSVFYLQNWNKGTFYL